MRFDIKEDGKRILMVCVASLIMALNIKTFVRTGGLYPGGATGLTILIQRVADMFFGIAVPYTLVNVILNAIPVYIGFRFIGKKFTLYSCLMILLTGILTDLIPGYPITYDTLLISVFGGLINGAVISLCLFANATSGGTDFIALYISNKSGREIWNQVFVFNSIMLMIFGCIFGFEAAGYSILFQFISTKTVSNFHTRYKRVMLQIFTKRKDEIMAVYCKNFHHGMTVLDGIGGYSKEPVSMLTAIVSSYEVDDVIMALKKADPKVIINVTKSEKYVGRFYNAPL